MKNLTKIAIAAAMLASTGAANASIAQGSTDATREAYLSVYDSVQAKTFDLDLGVTLADLIFNVDNAAYSLNFDLTTYANWNTFAANLNAGSTVYSIATGRASKFVTTLANPVANFTGTESQAVATAINNHAGQINVGTTIADTAANLSKLVADSDTPQTGQYNNFDSLFGTADAKGVHASIAYGNEALFQYILGSNIVANQINKSFAGIWKLSGNTLSFSAPAPAAVPLPAAVWMFGAGLMAMLRANRRKSFAA